MHQEYNFLVGFLWGSGVYNDQLMLENSRDLEDHCKPFMLLLGSSRHAKLGHLFVDFWNRFFPSSYDGAAVQAAEHTGEFDAACRRCADGRGHCTAGSLESIAETLVEPITVQTTLT